MLREEYRIKDEGLDLDESIPAPRVEVTAAQQRMLGQVPPPPVLPKVSLILSYLERVAPEQATKLKADLVRWESEINWMKEELRSTNKALDAVRFQPDTATETSS